MTMQTEIIILIFDCLGIGFAIGTLIATLMLHKLVQEDRKAYLGMLRTQELSLQTVFNRCNCIVHPELDELKEEED